MKNSFNFIGFEKPNRTRDLLGSSVVTSPLELPIVRRSDSDPKLSTIFLAIFFIKMPALKMIIAHTSIISYLRDFTSLNLCEEKNHSSLSGLNFFSSLTNNEEKSRFKLFATCKPFYTRIKTLRQQNIHSHQKSCTFHDSLIDSLSCRLWNNNSMSLIRFQVTMERRNCVSTQLPSKWYKQQSKRAVTFS